MGINFMGIWALILGYTSILSQSVSSITTNLIRKIASFSKTDFDTKISKLICNALLIYLCFFVLLLVIVLLLIHLLVPLNYLQIVGYSVIYTVIASNFITLLTSIFSTILDGKNNFYLKNACLIIALLISFVFFIFTVKIIGVWSLAVMLLLQATISLILIFIYVTRRNKLQFSVTFLSINNAKELFRESWKLQIISITVLCYEPIIKYFLSMYGIANVAFYEISNKIIFQIKNLFAVGIQTLMPKMINLYKSSENDFVKNYYQVKTFTISCVLILFSCVMLVLPIVCIFFLKSKSDDFYRIFAILSIGNIVNAIAIPSHIKFIAINKINTPLLSFLIILVCLIITCPLLGFFFNGVGVIVAVSCSLIIGSLVTIMHFEHLYKIPENKLNKLIKYFAIFNFIATVFITCFHIQSIYIRTVCYILIVCFIAANTYFSLPKFYTDKNLVNE